MKTRSRINLAAVLAGAAIAGTATAAPAFDFKTNYDAALSGGDKWKGNLMLESVEFGGQTYTDFGLVESANIVSNDLWTGGNTGAASADMGDKATIGLSSERASAADIAQALGNRNLSSIIDTEDRGNFAIDLFFDSAIDNLLVWERGKNSKLDVQAIDKDGNALGNLLHLGSSRNWGNAGYSLNTLEIGGTQTVGSRGVSLADLGVSEAIYGVRVISQSNYNGPDWKVAGTAAPDATTPEPFSMIGSAIALGGAAALKRRSKQK